MKLIKYILLIVISFTNSFCKTDDLISKLNQEWRWIKYDNHNGLGFTKVNDIVESGDGTIWALGVNEIKYFDGFVWQAPNIPKNLDLTKLTYLTGNFDSGVLAIIDNSLYSIKQGKTNTIDIKSMLHFTHGENVVLKSVAVVGQDHFVLLTTNEHGNSKVFRVNSNKVSLLKEFNVQYKPGQRLVQIEHSSGLLGYDNKLYYINKNNVSEILFGNNNFSLISFKTAFKNSKGEIIFDITSPSELRGIWKYIPSTKMLQNLNSDYIVYKSIENIEDKIYIALTGSIQFRFYDAVSNNWTDYNIESHYLINTTKIIYTKKKKLIAATSDGLSICNLEHNRWLKANNEQLRLGANEIVFHANYYWVSNYESVTKFTKDWNQVLQLDNVNGKKLEGINALNVDNNGNVWIGSGNNFNGAYMWNGKTWKHFTSKDGFTDQNIHRIKKNNNGDLVFLTISNINNSSGDGFYILEDSQFKHFNAKKNGIVDDRVYDFIDRGEKGYWIASYKGISQIVDNFTINSYNIADSLGISRVFVMSEYDKNILFFSYGTFNIGMIKNDSLFLETIKFELDGAGIFNIQKHKDNRMWVSTTKGIKILEYSDKKLIELANINQKNGLISGEIWPILFADSLVIMGAYDIGIVLLNTKAFSQNLPQSIIEKIATSEGISSIYVNSGSYQFESKPDNLEIRWKFNDNDDWSIWTNDKVIHQRNLPYGSNKIQIQTKNLLGHYNENGETFYFDIEAPIYYNAYYYVPSLILLIFFGFVTYNYFNKIRQSRIEIENLNRDLEYRVEDRTKKLRETTINLQQEIKQKETYQKELVIQSSKVEQALVKEKELSDFRSNIIAMISHEFRTPLTVISNSIYILETAIKKNKLDNIDKYFQRTHSSLKTLVSMLDDVTKVESSKLRKLEFSPLVFDLDTMCREVIDDLSSLTEMDHNIDYRLVNVDTNIRTDRKLLKIIYSNLLSNAVKYSQAGKTIKFILEKDGDALITTISDSGMGISSDDLPNIFEPFFRSKEHIALVQGTGLGLSIVKSCIDTIKGEISINSKLGEGTTFIVKINDCFLD